MSRSLVLNATYEPLSIVPSRRAAVLVLGHNADALHDTGEALHSEHLTVPLPSVVRLRSFVQLPYRRPAPLPRRAIFACDDLTFQYCDAAAQSIDHVVPSTRAWQLAGLDAVAACRTFH